MKILLLILVVILWTAPDAAAFFKDDGQGSQDAHMIQDMLQQKAYYDLSQERKRKAGEARSVLEKKKATLTPFVQIIPKESEGSLKEKKGSGKDDLLRKKDSNESTSPAKHANISEEIMGGIVANVLVIIACIVGLILLSRFFFRKSKRD